MFQHLFFLIEVATMESLLDLMEDLTDDLPYQVSTPFLPNRSRYIENLIESEIDKFEERFQHLFFLIEVATVDSNINFRFVNSARSFNTFSS